jgi:diaminopimelate epimerase
LSPGSVQVRFPGGGLHVERTPDQVMLTGPAERVFDGEADIERLLARS